MQNINRFMCEENIKQTGRLYKQNPELIKSSIVLSKKYDTRSLQPGIIPKYTPYSVEVCNMDLADAGNKLKQKGFNPVILNMASDKSPGGGWRHGAVGQEESLFYRSLYYLALEDPWKININSLNFYPLGPYEQIYTPNVYFFRDNQTNGFRQYDEKDCFSVSCIAVSAIRKPQLVNNKYTLEDYDLMCDKFRGLFKLALHYKHDSVVVGALGCGAFGNPPEQVAEICFKIIDEYKAYFKTIVVAILDYGTSHNYETFVKEMEKNV